MTPRSSGKKRKKTRYLSLRRRLAAASSAGPMASAASSPPSSGGNDPNAAVQPDDSHEEQLSRFFPNDDAVSLHSLLGSPGGAATTTAANSSSSVLSEDPLSTSSSSANYSACSSSYGSGLAKAALRGRERWAAAEEECDVASRAAEELLSSAPRLLSLKLDYDGILNTWPDQSSLYVEEEEGHQVVPDLYHTAVPLHYSAVFIDVTGGGGGAVALWTVPDGGDCAGEEKAAEAQEDREARVMRYKEKRRRRLYDKRIRYEVRKLNAEKRPRLKGRFVRRDDDC